MIDPLDLNGLYLVDALIYSLQFDSLLQSAIITIEVDITFHTGVLDLLPDLGPRGETLIDLVFSSAQSFVLERIKPRALSWKADEKPHDWEIAEWKVRKVRARSHEHVLTIRCQLGQTVQVAFQAVAIQVSHHKMAAVHNYD